MYRKTNEIADMHGFIYKDGKVYTHRKTTGTLQELSLAGDVLWESKEIGIWCYNVYKNIIIFNLKKTFGITRDTYIYDKMTKQIRFHRDLVLNSILEDEYYRDNILYSFDDTKAILFNLVECEIVKEIPFNSKGVPALLTEMYFVEKNSTTIFVYSILDLSFKWELNLVPLLPNAEEKLRIKQINEYQGSILVVTTAGVLRLSPDDGSIIWKTCSYAVTMEIVDNIGYACSGLSLYKINLDTGEESGYGREYNRLPDFKYKGFMYYPDGYRVVYHDGLLWYSVFSSGHSFLLAINPTDGNYEWIHHVDTYEKAETPQFYGDKMFLWDTGQVLHIYEKEK